MQEIKKVLSDTLFFWPSIFLIKIYIVTFIVALRIGHWPKFNNPASNWIIDEPWHCLLCYSLYLAALSLIFFGVKIFVGNFSRWRAFIIQIIFVFFSFYWDPGETFKWFLD